MEGDKEKGEFYGNHMLSECTYSSSVQLVLTCVPCTSPSAGSVNSTPHKHLQCKS